MNFTVYKKMFSSCRPLNSSENANLKTYTAIMKSPTVIRCTYRSPNSFVHAIMNFYTAITCT